MRAETDDRVIQGADHDVEDDQDVFPSWGKIWDHCNINRDTELSKTQLALAVQAHPDTSTTMTSGAKNKIEQANREDELHVRKVRAHELNDGETIITTIGYVLPSEGES